MGFLSIVDLDNQVSGGFVVLHLAHLILGDPFPHAFNDFLTLLALQVGVVAEIAESHTHVLLLQLGIGDLDVVLRNSDAGA